LFDNRSVPQTACADCAAGKLKYFSAPSPTAEKATASKDQSGQASTGNGTRRRRL